MADQEVDLDSIIDRLLEVRGSRPGKQVQLLESEIRFLCTKAREIFISQPTGSAHQGEKFLFVSEGVFELE